MGWKGTARKVERKVFGKGGAKRRYGIGKGKGGFKLAKLAADLEMVKSRLNVEKKQIERDVTTNSVAQAYAETGDGLLAIDVTPSMAQGTGEAQRVGNSVKITGMSFPMSFSQQINCMGDRKVRVSLLRVRDLDASNDAYESARAVWDTNPLTGLTDFNSMRAYRNSKNDGISVIRSQVYTVKGPDVIQGTGSIDQERNVKSCRFNVKLQDILRFAQDSDSNNEGIRYYLIFQCNAGNSHPSLDSTKDIPVTYRATGLALRLCQRIWYVDN